MSVPSGLGFRDLPPFGTTQPAGIPGFHEFLSFDSKHVPQTDVTNLVSIMNPLKRGFEAQFEVVESGTALPVASPSKRQRKTDSDDSRTLDVPLSPVDFAEFLSSNPVKQEEDTQESLTPAAGTNFFATTLNDGRTASNRLGSWSENLSLADKRAAERFLQLPNRTLVETMFHIKSRYEGKVRGIVNQLKDDLQFTRDTNTVLVKQLVESNERENAYSDMFTSTLSQLVESEQAKDIAQVTCQNLAAELVTLRTQLEELQREAAKPEVRWNEESDTIQISLGVPVSVQRVSWKVLSAGTLDSLSFTALDRIIQAKDIWRKIIPPMGPLAMHYPGPFHITKIEYVMNEVLEMRFNGAKEELERLGRPTTETMVFHGTAVGNINSILTEGFKIGGVDGHTQAHGASNGYGVYCASNPAMSLGYNLGSNEVGTRRLLACKALPGVTSNKNLGRKVVGKIGSAKFDSYSAGGVFVIRRSCQLLPCLVIHY